MLNLKSIGLASIFLGSVVSEAIRTPTNLIGFLYWTHLNLIVFAGFIGGGFIRSIDPMNNLVIAGEGKIEDMGGIEVLLFCMIGAGWCLRWWAMRELNEAFSVNYNARPKAIVTSGPYAFVRHPGYACFLLNVPSAASIAAGSLTYGLFVLALLCLFYGKLEMVEESLLLKSMPEQYKAYRKLVPYRMLPGIF